MQNKAEVRTRTGEVLKPGDPRLAAGEPLRLPAGVELPALEPLGPEPVAYGIFAGAE